MCFLCNRPAIWTLSMDWLCQSGLHRPLGFVRLHLHTSGPHQQRCITSTIQNAFSLGMQVEHLHPLCLLGSEDGPKGWSDTRFFLQATICWWPSIWQAHQGSKLVAKKTFDLMIGAKDRSLMNGKLKAFPVCGAQRLNQPLLYLSFGTENGYHIIYCRSICSSWATNQFHLWFTILERSTHPPSTKKRKKTLNIWHGWTWFFQLVENGFRFPLLSFGEGCNLSASLRQYVPYIWPYGRHKQGCPWPLRSSS